MADFFEIFLIRLEQQNGAGAVLALDAHVNVGHGHDLAQPDVEPANAVAGADDQSVGEAGVRRFQRDIADDVQFMLSPGAAQFAQRRLAHPPAEDIPRADVTMRLLDLVPPVGGFLRLVPNV